MLKLNLCGGSSVGRASAFQAECREFESRLPLQNLLIFYYISYQKSFPNLSYFLNFFNLLIYKNYNKMIKTNIKLRGIT